MRPHSNGISVFHPNANPIYSNGVFTSDIFFYGSEVTMTMPSTTSTGTERYETGDSIVMRIGRDADDSADTCAGDFYIIEMYAIYQGLTSYLPLVATP